MRTKIDKAESFGQLKQVGPASILKTGTSRPLFSPLEHILSTVMTVLVEGRSGGGGSETERKLY